MSLGAGVRGVEKGWAAEVEVAAGGPLVRGEVVEVAPAWLASREVV